MRTGNRRRAGLWRSQRRSALVWRSWRAAANRRSSIDLDRVAPSPLSMRLHRFAYAAALTFAAALAAGLAGEFAARADDRLRDGVPMISAPELHYDLIIRDSLGSRGKPFGRYQRWALNSAGFRSDESTLVPRPGCTRVMTLGSSETFGVAGESPNKEYPAQLGDSLAPHGCYQVLNAGIVGLTLPGITQMWNVWGSRFDPQVAVILANPMVYLGDDPPARTVVGNGRSQPRPPWWTPRLVEKAHQAIHYPEVIQRRRVQRQLDGLLQGHPPEWIFFIRSSRAARSISARISTVWSPRACAHGVKPVLVVVSDAIRQHAESAGSSTSSPHGGCSARAPRPL